MANRASIRNIHFYDAISPEVSLGGIIQNGSVTEANFLDMLRILLITESPFKVRQRGTDHIVTRTNDPLNVGEYDIICESPVQVNDEPWIQRLFSHNTSGKEDGLCEEVRARDRKCVFSGIVVPDQYVQSGLWTSFEAAHIFPLSSEDLWIEHNYSQWITNMDDTKGKSKINSCQNGLLLVSNVHQQFNQYLISVNPDDNYKVISFGLDIFRLDGRVLDPVCRNPEDPDRVSDELLRWHYRQCVFANMRGAGEPVIEHDFVGRDMIKVISEEEYGKERFEKEIAVRLRGY